MSLDELRATVAFMREVGCIHLAIPDATITLGPAPHAAPTREADPDVVAEESADHQAIREYQEHLYGAQGHGPRQ